MPQKPKVAVIIAAGGLSNRMGGLDKLYARLGGKPVLVRATLPFQKSPLVDQIVVVVAGEKVSECRQLIPEGEWSKVTNICAGGERRQDSVAAGLKLIGKCDWAIIHDGTRPFVTADLIERGLVPKVSARVSPPKDIELIPVSTLREAINIGLVRGKSRSDKIESE